MGISKGEGGCGRKCGDRKGVGMNGGIGMGGRGMNVGIGMNGERDE